MRGRFLDDDALPVESFYEPIRAAGLDYGVKFRCIQQLWHRHHEMLARLELPAELVHESQRNAVHPALLDACLHVVFADVHRTGDPDRIFLPYRIDRVRFYRRPTQNIWADVRVTRNDDEYLCSDTLIFDEAGELVAEVLGLTCKRLAEAGSRQADTLYEGCYEYQWTPAPRHLEFHRRIFDYTRAVLIADAAGLASELAVRLVADGIEPRVIRFNPRDTFDVLLADVALDRRTLIVFAAGLSEPSSVRSRVDSGWKGLAHCPHFPALLQLVQTLLKRQGVPRLCVVTNGAAGVAGDQQLDLGQAILHGMGRVINNECPNVPLTVIDLSESVTSGEIDSLYHELLHSRLDRDEPEIALRGEQRFVRQLVSVDRESAEQAAVSEEP